MRAHTKRVLADTTHIMIWRYVTYESLIGEAGRTELFLTHVKREYGLGCESPLMLVLPNHCQQPLGLAVFEASRRKRYSKVSSSGVS